MHTKTTSPNDTTRVIQFDARPMLAEGAEPLTEILASTATLTDGDQLEIIAPFEPVPLYDVLRARGFRVDLCILNEETGAWHTRFTRVNIVADHTVGHVLATHPSTRATISRFGLDTCCGANLSLQQASDSRGIVIESLLLELHTDAVR